MSQTLINLTHLKDRDTANAFDSLAGGNSTAASPQLVFDGQSTNSLTAAGTNRATALTLTAQFNRISTAAASTGVTLPTPIPGVHIFVDNAGANAITVYAPGSVTIDGTAGATGVPLTNAKRAIFYAYSTTVYISAQMGVVSA